MPFYEYTACDPVKSCDYCINRFEVMQSIKDKSLGKCPQCNNKVIKLFSLIGGIVIKGRQANQYNNCKDAKYWRDQNGVRHKIGPGDGHSNSPTVPRRQTASPDQVKARIKRDQAKDKQKRTSESYNRYVQRVKKR